MGIKIFNTVWVVLAGVGAALLLFWILNKIAELLPGRWEDRIKPYFFILPAYAAIIVYLIYPAINTIRLSFYDSFSENWVGLQNYTDLLTNHAFQQTLINTLLWMIIVPVVTVIIGLGVAVLTDRLTPTGEKSAKTIIFLPMAISFVGAGVVWRFLYAYRAPGQPQIGLQNAIVTAFGHDPVPWLEQSQFHINSLFLMVMLLWAQIGLSMVLLSAAVKGVPGETLEAARIDGANERQIFFRVIVPQVKGTIVTVFITTLIAVMKIFDVVYVMTGGSFNTNVVGLEFFNQLFTNFNYGTSSAIVVMLMIATIPIMFYQVRHFKAEEANG
jgi:alpha-glucoside transport system permease protein